MQRGLGINNRGNEIEYTIFNCQMQNIPLKFTLHFDQPLNRARSGKIPIMKTLFAIIIAILLNVGQTHAQDYSKDTNSIDAIIAAMYECISGPAGVERDWNRFRNLFHPYANINSLNPDDNGMINFNLNSVREYIENASPFFEINDFYEYEISRTTDEFYGLAQVFSTYEFTTKKDGPVIRRGINSIQLVRFEGRWWITVLTYNSENEFFKVPEDYLQKN